MRTGQAHRPSVSPAWLSSLAVIVLAFPQPCPAALGGDVSSVKKDQARLKVCRDRARGNAALERVAKVATGAPPMLLLADLSSQAAVRSLAADVRREVPRIDVLINNAGAAFPRRELSADGIEMTLATNHLAPFLSHGDQLWPPRARPARYHERDGAVRGMVADRPFARAGRADRYLPRFVARGGWSDGRIFPPLACAAFEAAHLRRGRGGADVGRQ